MRKNILNKKEILKLVEELDIKGQLNGLEQSFESLRHDIWEFGKTVDEIKYLQSQLNEDFEYQKTADHKKARLLELIENLSVINDRIQKDIIKINKFLKNKDLVSERSIKTSNQSLKDLFTNYEITIARYKSFIDDFEIEPDLLKKALRVFTDSMSELDSVIYNFNSQSPLRLLVPSEESKIVGTIMQYGFSVVSEKEWKDLVKYR